MNEPEVPMNQIQHDGVGKVVTRIREPRQVGVTDIDTVSCRIRQQLHPSATSSYRMRAPFFNSRMSDDGPNPDFSFRRLIDLRQETTARSSVPQSRPWRVQLCSAKPNAGTDSS